MAKPERTELASYPWRQRRDYLMLVAAVAASDSQLQPEELALLNQWMDLFRLPEKSRELVMQVAHRQQADVAAIAARLKGTDLVYSVMLDMMGMAMADGVLMDDEILLLQGLADTLQISPTDFQILIEFVHSAHQAAQMGNPEPLFEHNIDRAFDLLRQRHVHLFGHTLLCSTFPEYDQQLKARWSNFAASHH